MRKNVYDPFTEATGITVVPVAATVAKLLAMFESGNVELDLIDTGEGPLIQLERKGALTPIDYGSWKLSKPENITEEYKSEFRVTDFAYATVLAYNTDTFKGDAHPDNWPDFWDAEKFPGPRMLADMATGTPNLEFALIADGVALKDLYPLDVDRAFKSLSRIRPAITRFWDTGALSAQLMTDAEVVTGSIWNGRLQAVMDKGAPLSFTWNQHMLQLQQVAIFKDSPNVAEAQQLIDFMMQPSVQAGYGAALRYSPSNTKAFDLIDPKIVEQMPGNPATRDKAFVQNVAWWEDNRDAINKRWSSWILG
nr:ABC transporter substrate-binding protein [Jiella sonneratiae]